MREEPLEQVLEALEIQVLLQFLILVDQIQYPQLVVVEVVDMVIRQENLDKLVDLAVGVDSVNLVPLVLGDQHQRLH